MWRLKPSSRPRPSADSVILMRGQQLPGLVDHAWRGKLGAPRNLSGVISALIGEDGKSGSSFVLGTGGDGWLSCFVHSLASVFQVLVAVRVDRQVAEACALL